ncbi:biotin--[acetyl-CoA-carboxylase] ligase [Tetragenococcus koreensis]|uniref:Bifunctional ligase/repressor BirA n=1 Tax=Tetragenococcus koreensis TaxID=290335 RepID=A0AAN4RIJ3_9ENTE|nr:biotin--[acetyl-CoA-carboxylase] ligase [Tetragenococcus koreensis]MDN6507391.1 biotin--[acetyl-CoA-carboxylase] ligase [Tetragenococcus halophilus]AYW46253.1 biotin--[acetyl-CoA-carboxylase] ligase [Tetragenococcus koreensis]MCF1585044.1 biotin--[acetyl-CoA-carboxylase] ligase [Tetragenococcus koreensis]MCF1614607.1 biotin--[acetyl-CoA-carboxylase] ligase [Tetragenococcus koreensis]MCF1617116.1 biotin--[acetyl-CoA-carboxylase] ligase [Tetragenococcus koreensis]
MSTKQKILAILRQDNGIVSGEKLADTLGISRTAIWKAVRELEKMGYHIEHFPNGYRYLTSDVLEKELISNKALPTSSIFIKEETESTMNDAKVAAIKQQTAPALFIAEKQTGGHGRFGRPFFSPTGQIYMSLLLAPNQTFAELPQYTILAAVALSLAIDHHTGKQTQIKWVNDIYLDGKKICGILSEATSDFETGQIKHVILGCGINYSIDPESFPEELQAKAGSIFPQENPPVTRNQLIQLIWQYFFELVEGLPNKEYLDVYRKKSFVLGKTVQFSQQGVAYSGKATKITDTGELVVQTNQGVKTLSSGEISLEAIY